MGNLRFNLYGAYLILKLKKYRCRLTYSTTESDIPPLNVKIDSPDYITVENTFISTIFSLLPYTTDKIKIAPLLSIEDKAFDMQLMPY